MRECVAGSGILNVAGIQYSETSSGSGQYRFRGAAYDAVHPLGFYELRNVVSNMTQDDIVYTYLFTTNGCAPRPLGENEFLLNNDYHLFQSLFNQPLPDAVSNAIDEAKTAKNKTLRDKLNKSDLSSLGWNGSRFTWKTLFLTNLASFNAQPDRGFWRSADGLMDVCGALGSIFNYENPFTRNTIIFAVRDFNGNFSDWSEKNNVYIVAGPVKGGGGSR